MGRATSELVEGADTTEGISIHALRGEGDADELAEVQRKLDISIHALRGEGDDVPDNIIPLPKIFQSTPSVGRATN